MVSESLTGVENIRLLRLLEGSTINVLQTF